MRKNMNKMFIPHTEESLEEKKRIEKYDAKDTKLNQKRGKFVPVEDLTDGYISEDDILDKIDNPDKIDKQHRIERDLQGDKKIKPGARVRMKDNTKVYYEVIDVNFENSEVILKHPGTSKEKTVDISVLGPRTVSSVLGKAA